VLLLQFLEHTFQHHHEEPVDDTNIANLIAHIFQSPPPSNEKDFQNIDRSSFPVISLFNAPAANLFITIEDVDQEILAKYPTLSIKKNRKAVEITSTFQSRDSVSSVESIISAAPPSKHGIVGRSWLSTSGTESTAFKDIGTGSHADSLFDVFALTSPDSFIFSMSSDEQLAAAISVRPHTHRSLPNVVSHFWNSRHQNFDSVVRHQAGLTIHSSRAEILQSFQEQLYQYDGIKLAYDGKNMQLHVSVSSEDIDSVPFDLNSEDDFRVFVEIFFIEAALKSFREEKIAQLMNDEHPDSFAFAFAGIRNIRKKYGADSPQFVAALYLLDQAVAKLTQEISALYKNKISSEVICLSVPSAIPENEELLQRFDEILPNVGDLKSYLPDIYMGNELSATEEKTLVSFMNTFLKEFGMVAYWFGRQDLHAQEVFLAGKRSQRHVGEQALPYEQARYSEQRPSSRWSVRSWFGFQRKDENRTYTLNEVNNFQIVVWTSLILILTAIGASCSLCVMNPEKNNELLYLQTALGRETDTIPGGDYDFRPM